MKFNVITGLPRSGSTLLCNILNQNPRFYASTTSLLPFLLNGVVHGLSTTIEAKAMLQADRSGTEQRVRDVLRAMVENWYREIQSPVIFDKSRAWSSSALLLKELYPASNILVTVRDLRSVCASAEKQHRRTALFDDAPDPPSRTMYYRADKLFSPTGLIGSAIVGVEDMLRRRPAGAIFVRYESLANDPAAEMASIYRLLGEPEFQHDFEHIVNTAGDPDAFYLYKFPHEGCGKVQAEDPEQWRQYLSPDIAAHIGARFAMFQKAFGYEPSP